MRRLTSFLLAAILALTGAIAAPGTATAADAGDAERVAVGERIYREGILSSGQRVVGIAQAGVQRSGPDAACVACHRRSGFGGSEGSLEIPSIAGPSLFGKRDGRPDESSIAAKSNSYAASSHAAGAAADPGKALRDARAALLTGGARNLPAYDDAALRRAIREGIDVTGRKLNPAMPRYTLDDGDVDALVAYLKTLSAKMPPGVADDVVHFATVIQSGVDPAKRQAMLEVIRGFVDDRNAQMRVEAQSHPIGSARLGRTFREWRLHVWDLAGRSDSWAGQLESSYRKQPVFALLGGIGDESWRPIHEFSERFEVPCIFPQTDVPVVDGRGIYTVYLSKGIVLEADALAKYLQQAGEAGRLVQVRRRDGASAAAADALRKARLASAGVAPAERVLDGAPTKTFWQQLAGEFPDATWVMWLSPADLADLMSSPEVTARAKAVYLSSAMLAGEAPDREFESAGRVRLIYPMDLPQARAARLEVVRRWLHRKGIALTDETVQSNAYLAAVVTAGAMAHTMDTYSRDYLLERVEHRVGNAVDPSLYPRLSLGPGQRFASKGSYIVDLGTDGAGLKPVSDWLVP